MIKGTLQKAYEILVAMWDERELVMILLIELMAVAVIASKPC